MGVRGLLEAEPDIEVIGEAGTAAAALAQIPALRPRVAVLDVRLPDGDVHSLPADYLLVPARPVAAATAHRSASSASPPVLGSCREKLGSSTR
jgi:DNA-binding NarL/FixJ family response regulator